MKFMINVLFNGIILFLGSTQLNLIVIQDFATAVLLALVTALITFLIRVVVVPMKILGCLTLGLSYIAGVILGAFAVPIALYQASSLVKGVGVIGRWETFILGMIIVIVNNIVLGREKEKA